MGNHLLQAARAHGRRRHQLRVHQRAQHAREALHALCLHGARAAHHDPLHQGGPVLGQEGPLHPLVHCLQVGQAALLRQSREAVLRLAAPPVLVGHAELLVELDLQRVQRAQGQGVVVALDHHQAVRGVQPVLGLLRGRLAHLPRRRVLLLRLAAAGGALLLLLLAAGAGMLPALRLKDLQDSKGNSQQRVLVLVHSILLHQSRNAGCLQLNALAVLQAKQLVGDCGNHCSLEALAEPLLQALAGSL
ncbi:uncharacterized protein [Penaeus vannamei]|uniref:uncharacterized protein n=1 Tax=Penaeus vannamei TaxID=6689 RepID=UPI00387F5F63